MWTSLCLKFSSYGHCTSRHSPPVSLLIIDGLWLPMSVLRLSVLPGVLVTTAQVPMMMVTTELLSGPVIAQLPGVAMTLTVL